jgi:hypothetical protein
MSKNCISEIVLQNITTPLWEVNKENYLHTFSSLCLKMCEYERKIGSRKGEKTRTKLQNLLEKAQALGTQQTCLKYRSWDFLGCWVALGFNLLQTFRCNIKSPLQVLKEVPRTYLCRRITGKWKAMKSKGHHTVFTSIEENDLLAILFTDFASVDFIPFQPGLPQFTPYSNKRCSADWNTVTKNFRVDFCCAH